MVAFPTVYDVLNNPDKYDKLSHNTTPISAIRRVGDKVELLTPKGWIEVNPNIHLLASEKRVDNGTE